MPETLTEKKNADAEFFTLMLKDPTFANVIKRFGFETPSIGISQYNAVLNFTKPAWILRRPEGHERTLDIHFEAKGRSEIRLEVGAHPWIASLDKKPDEKAALAPMLARKTRVIRALRQRLIGASDVPDRFDANDKSLRDPAETASHGAVKFSGRAYMTDPTVEQAAHWFVEVIETITPIIDEVVDRHQEG